MWLPPLCSLFRLAALLCFLILLCSCYLGVSLSEQHACLQVYPENGDGVRIMAKCSTVDVPPGVHVSINACRQGVRTHGIHL